MEVEHINENTIRVVIDNNDLEERGVSVLDLIGDQEQIESFFYSILEEVDVDQNFYQSESLTFQVLPHNNGLELFITKDSVSPKSNDDEDSSYQDEESVSEMVQSLIETLDQTNEPKTWYSDEDDEDEFEKVKYEPTHFSIILKFKDFEHLIQLTKLIAVEGLTSNLYLYKDTYYLETIFPKYDFTPEMIANAVSQQIEYGENTGITKEILEEHGQIIMSPNALELISYYFK